MSQHERDRLPHPVSLIDSVLTFQGHQKREGTEALLQSLQERETYEG
jgi:hypothetical protein